MCSRHLDPVDEALYSRFLDPLWFGYTALPVGDIV